MLLELFLPPNPDQAVYPYVVSRSIAPVSVYKICCLKNCLNKREKEKERWEEGRVRVEAEG